MKLIAILFGIVLIGLILLAPVNLAHAEYDGFGNYFCGEDKEVAELEYEGEVGDFNFGVEERSGSIEELNKFYLDKRGSVDDLGKMAECLKEEHNIDPDSVIMLSDKGQEVLSYDMEKLFEIAPGLAKYATVPEFQEIAIMVLGSGIIGIIAISNKFKILKH